MPPKYTSSQKFDVIGSRRRKSAEKTNTAEGSIPKRFSRHVCPSVSGLFSFAHSSGKVYRKLGSR
jgi:hypothetical protein